MPDERGRCASFNKRLFVHTFDGLCLLLILLAQGTVLNYYIIDYYKSSVTPYFLFIADFFCLFAFVFTFGVSYKFLKKHYSPRSAGSLVASQMRAPTHSSLGDMPLSYASWLFYVMILVTKIVVIFESGIVDNLSPKEHLGPQLLKVTIGVSSFVFLLLVEGHNWSKRGSPRYSYVTSVCAKTGIELFDSISILSILMEGPDELSEALKDLILILATINFFLPSITLYQLSLADFSVHKLSQFSTLIQLIIHLIFVNVPFLALRLYLWLAFRENASMFIMKNMLSIVLTLRGMYPDLVEFKNDYLSRRSVLGRRETPKEAFEVISLHDKPTHV